MSLGRRPTPSEVVAVHLEVVAALAQLEAEIQTGSIGKSTPLVRGLPLAEWLSMDELARLLRLGKSK